jgi:hypothetical protein
MSYDAQAIEAKIEAALARIRTLLDNTRNPRAPADVPHAYDDKYHLSEFVTRVSIAAIFQCLEVVGLSAEGLSELREWSKTRTVTLRLEADENCRLLREEQRKVESPEAVTETRGFLGKTTTTQKIVTTVTEWFWAFDFNYEILAYQGNTPEKAVRLHGRSGKIEIKTGAKVAPRPASVVRPPIEVSLTWLLQHLDAEGRAAFTIDRAATTCRTPRRNEPVDEALRELTAFHAFCEAALAYFWHDLFPVQEHALDLTAIDARDVFVPVVPIFEDGERNPGEPLLPPSYANAFLAEEKKSLAEKCRVLSSVFPRDASVITAASAGLCVTLSHAVEVCKCFAGGVAYIEEMLRRQLRAAIGKEIGPRDFGAFMQFHERRLFRPEFRPQPFSYAIRRPEHDPEGVLSLEAEIGGATPEPVATTVAHRRATSPMSFPLDASTRVRFMGDRYLHGWVVHQFSGQGRLPVRLTARARQFSSFIVLVGRIASADTFEPRYGVVVQNKDLVHIPLLLEQLPTPKEFRDAIESLSPEQQRFARAFRGMQLESTLFGVCVIQIKPQLEKLLGLVPDSLTKEIKLMQELLDLFIEHQIPSDLLSYDGPSDAPAEAKVTRVGEYVGRMREMIASSKQREIEEEREREALRLAEMNRTPYAPPGMAPPMAGGMPPPAPAALPAAVAAVPRSSSMKMGLSFGAPPPPMAIPSPAAPPAPPAAAPPSFAADAATAVDPGAGSATPTPATPDARAVRASSSAASGAPHGDGTVDYTRIPGELDAKLEAIDEDDALRATILTPSPTWTRTRQKGLLSPPKATSLAATALDREKAQAFDLLDALTRSGAMAIEEASLHVVIAATHNFDRTLTDTVILDNVNPVEKVERSLLILGTTIHRAPAAELLEEAHRARVMAGTPRLGSGDDP